MIKIEEIHFTIYVLYKASNTNKATNNIKVCKLGKLNPSIKSEGLGLWIIYFSNVPVMRAVIVKIK